MVGGVQYLELIRDRLDHKLWKVYGLGHLTCKLFKSTYLFYIIRILQRFPMSCKIYLYTNIQIALAALLWDTFFTYVSICE